VETTKQKDERRKNLSLFKTITVKKNKSEELEGMPQQHHCPPVHGC
jgi:hypothetical protein